MTSEELYTQFERFLVDLHQKQERQSYGGLSDIWAMDDQLGFMRVHQLQGLCDLLGDLIGKSGLSLQQVLARAIKPSLADVQKQFPYLIKQLDLILEYYA